MSIYDLTQTTPSKLQTGDIFNCPYTGAAQTVLILEPEHYYSGDLYSGEV